MVGLLVLAKLKIMINFLKENKYKELTSKVNYKKIHIIGPPASGKTYFVNKLSKKFDIKHFDLDDIFWDKTVNRY